MNEDVNKLVKDKLGISQDETQAEDLSSLVEKEVDFDLIKELEAEAQEKQETESKKETTKIDNKRKPAKKVNIEKLNIVGSTELSKEGDLRAALYGNRAVFQVVAAQSGYMAKLSPLVNKDIFSLLYSNVSRYEYRRSVFKVVYDKIVAISSGKFSFEEWLKMTSVEDLETFYYGIYCSTFPNKGTFTFTCPVCGEETVIPVLHNSLVKTADRAHMRTLIKKVSENSRDRESMEELSLVGKTVAYQLSDTGIVVELRMPTLWDSLEVLRTVPEKLIDRDTDSVTNLLYVKRFLIPSKEQEGGYSEQTDRQQVLSIIDNLTIDDAAQLSDAISEKVDENRLSYSIKNITCSNPQCKHVVKDTPISIEDILFTQIYERTN